MTILSNFDGSDEFFDSRDVIARIEELTEEWEEVTGEDFDEYSLSVDDYMNGLSEDDAVELEALINLREEATGVIPDFEHGETFIHEDSFTDYAKELVTDTGYISADLPDWIEIDWEATAENIKVDYTEFEFRGETYYAR